MMAENIKKVYLAIVIIGFVAIFAGCIMKETPVLSKTPIWNVTDLEVEKLRKETPIYIYSHKITKSSLFSKEIEFKAGYPPSGFEEKRPLFYDFDDFVSYFVYDGTVLVGAKTYDKEGHLLAEAEVHYFISERNEQGIEIEEIHYAENKPIFRSKSLIDPYTGENIKRLEEVGNKVKDYYFIWPVS